jgi:ADP-ribose pyrophosphatase YjhB (NUDIX family)
VAFQKYVVYDMKKNGQLELIKRIKALSDAGLAYSENGYDVERFEEIRALSLELMGIITKEPLAVLEDFFLPEKDYPTPKVDIRGLVLNDKKEILLVQERVDGRWTLPGGWGDVGYSPSEVIRKEIVEETGLRADVVRLLAVYDKKCHPHPPQPFYVYKLVFLCKVVEGSIDPSFDILEAKYFDVQDLPELSEDRILKTQIEQLYNMVESTEMKAVFD